MKKDKEAIIFSCLYWFFCLLFFKWDVCLNKIRCWWVVYQKVQRNLLDIFQTQRSHKRTYSFNLVLLINLVVIYHWIIWKDHKEGLPFSTNSLAFLSTLPCLILHYEIPKVDSSDLAFSFPDHGPFTGYYVWSARYLQQEKLIVHLLEKTKFNNNSIYSFECYLNYPDQQFKRGLLMHSVRFFCR